jgi:hypothetical protein
MTLTHTYRLIARETHRVIARADRATDNDAAARVAAREAHEAAARARYLAAHAEGIDPAAFLRACGLPADARQYDPEPTR